ncbi:MAG TPA: GNAT family N-acetyltransferase [Mycobacteriales bacterium]|nr:GNAT family N-acetyltransferase [Mycobacteriales bacterium]
MSELAITAAATDNLRYVGFRPLGRKDLPLLFEWLRQPHVAKWWRDVPADLAAVEAEYGKCIDGDDPTELFVVEADRRAVGMIQRYVMADEPEWRRAFDGIADVGGAAGIDYLIGELDAIGAGIGSAMIAAFVPMVFEWHAVDSIVVTVQQANVASWRILEKSGFRRVWSGKLDSPDPSDQGPEHVYLLNRR